ncbi:MAG: BNR-repeat neuraminidase N-terminal domain-containing protein, partial [Planctomycetota bacterium]|nr:BNR-repeat neuraminidase N-terminal domain-containing protein [Planctomycetota bacterium]
MRLFKLPGCKITLCVLAAGMLIQAHAGVTAAELSAVVKKRVHPVLIRNDHNALLSLTITADKPFVQLESVTVSLAGCDDVQDLDTLKLFQASGEGKFETTAGFGDRLAAAQTMTFHGHARLKKGANVFWLSGRLKPDASLLNRVAASVTKVQTNTGSVTGIRAIGVESKRIGVALRRHWDDGVHTYRIPALATTTEGTLLCVYDMRRRKGKDLQEDIDIGLVRSTDGGKTWDPQRVIMDMGTYGGFA